MPSHRLTLSRILIGSAALVLIVVSVIVAIRWRQTPSDPYADVPFRPRVTYGSQFVRITNTEDEPYVDVSVHVYVDGTLYSAQIGKIDPGITVASSLRELTNSRGEQLDITQTRISELEVRARFKGYAVHKDFPPPHE